jgi:hypothetical protein
MHRLIIVGLLNKSYNLTLFKAFFYISKLDNQTYTLIYIVTKIKIKLV